MGTHASSSARVEPSVAPAAGPDVEVQFSGPIPMYVRLVDALTGREPAPGPRVVHYVPAARLAAETSRAERAEAEHDEALEVARLLRKQIALRARDEERGAGMLVELVRVLGPMQGSEINAVDMARRVVRERSDPHNAQLLGERVRELQAEVEAGRRYGESVTRERDEARAERYRWEADYHEKGRAYSATYEAWTQAKWKLEDADRSRASLIRTLGQPDTATWADVTAAVEKATKGSA